MQSYLYSASNAASKSSIPQEMLRLAREDADPTKSEVKKLLNRAQELSRNVDAVLIPGGSDIEPEFYGEVRGPKTNTESDYRRTVYELALIQQAREKGIPLMGICRGSQMGNVFYGGTLNQDVEGQFGEVQELSREESPGDPVGFIRGAVFGKDQDDGFKAISWHHQASQVKSDKLRVVIAFKTDDGQKIPKALEGTEGSPLLLIQFHPEHLKPPSMRSAADPQEVSEKNYDVFAAFKFAANQYRKRKIGMETLKVASAEVRAEMEAEGTTPGPATAA